jgi:ABC-type transport system involved in multi-copper enzyme maturation permease subunit
MLPGPVFDIELVTTARRARYFLLRSLYGLILLALIGNFFEKGPRVVRSGVAIGQMAQLTEGFFRLFALTQAGAVLAITPALVAGVIVDEKQRKTLPYLLASPLSSAEIVLGKLFARLLHLGVLLAAGLPILSLMTLLGGVDPWVLAAVYGATISGAFVVAGLSIFISTMARNTREAVALVYMVEAAWVIVAYLLTRATVGNAFALGAFIASQLALGGWLVFLAVSRLRSTLGDEGERPARRPGLIAKAKRWRWRLLPRPECWTDCMLWKELQVSRTSGVVKLVALILGGFAAAIVGIVVLRMGIRAHQELQVYGYGVYPPGRSARLDMNIFIRSATGIVHVLLLLGVASYAAAGVSSEREADTWTSLISTPLSGAEILRAKMIGAVWSMRWFALPVVGLWFVGAALDAVHAAALLLCAVELIVFLTFAAALGTFFSLRLRSTLRAEAATLGVLIFTNGGYLLCCAPFGPNTALVAAPCTPFVLAASLFPFEQVSRIFGPGPPFRLEFFLTCTIGFVAYAAAARFLVRHCYGRFDAILGRPERSADSSAPGRREPAAEAPGIHAPAGQSLGNRLLET